MLYDQFKDILPPDLLELIPNPIKFVEVMPTEYVFQEFFKMLLEHMERRLGLSNEEFNIIVEQKLNNEMGTSRKTMFEVAEERAELRITKCSL